MRTLSALLSGTVALALGLCAIGCSDDDRDPPPPAGSGATFGLTQRQTVQGLTFPSSSGGSGSLTATRAFPNLSFARPVFLTHLPDGTDRLLVVEQAGVIRLFDNSDAATTSSVFLDISARVSRASNEEGLLGLAFDPGFASNGLFYVHYSAASPRRSVISRFGTTSPTQGDAGSETVLLTVNQPFSNHNGGMLAFGPDGFLYVALGDGGSGGDPLNSGQDTSTLLGSLLRIDVRSTPYTIPASNPLVGSAGRDEIWAYGLRNPWRFSFDRSNGTLWLGDVGQGAREEIDIVTRGANLGWRVFEGDVDHDNPGSLPASSFTQPVIDYGRSQGATVVGGYVYRGGRFPNQQGTYFYGDYVSGRVWALVVDGSNNVLSNTEFATVPSLSSFGEDRDGELFAVSLNGGIYRIEQGSGGGGGTFPARLSGTGLFTNVATLTPTPGVIEYGVNASFWSDGASKRRWIALPGTAQITFASSGAWSFPVGTVLVKHFELETSPGTFQRLETRVLIHETPGVWNGYAYRWNASQTDADLLSGAQDVAVVAFDPTQPTGQLAFTYHVPSRAECASCHNGADGFVLGIKTDQLNRTFAYPNGVTDNQLRAWNNISLFSTNIGGASQYGSLTDPADTGASTDARARAYLDVNCSPCHRPGGPAPGGLDLRWATPLTGTNTLGVAPSEGDLGLTNPLRIRQGEKETSVLWERLRRTDSTRMPPPSNRVDPLAESLIGSWIDGL